MDQNAWNEHVDDYEALGIADEEVPTMTQMQTRESDRGRGCCRA